LNLNRRSISGLEPEIPVKLEVQLQFPTRFRVLVCC
jgi:hypothetical protein